MTEFLCQVSVFLDRKLLKSVFSHRKSENIDDQHRRRIRFLPEVRSATGIVVPVCKDGASILYVDCLWLEGEMSRTVGLVRLLTPFGHIYTALSFLRTLIRAVNRGGAFPGDKYRNRFPRELKKPDNNSRGNALVKCFAGIRIQGLSALICPWVVLSINF